MFNKNKAKQITLSIASFYCLAGNIIGYCISTLHIPSDGLLFYLFIPYTFIWVISAMVGFDWLSFVFEIMAFLLSVVVFFPIGLYFANPTKKSNVKEKE